jgi:hypothetical protein
MAAERAKIGNADLDKIHTETKELVAMFNNPNVTEEKSKKALVGVMAENIKQYKAQKLGNAGSSSYDNNHKAVMNQAEAIIEAYKKSNN